MIDFVEMRLHAGSTTTFLPDFSTITADTKYNDLGAIEFTYPLTKAKALSLTDQSIVSVTTGFDGGTALEIERYVIESTNDEKVSDGERLRTLTGRSLLSTMDDAVVYPSNWPVVNPPGHEFVEQNLGTIFRTLVDRAQARGALSSIDETTFSGTLDSNGVAWSHQHTQTFATGTGYYTILTDFMNRGLCDAWMDANSTLRIVNGGTRGAHIGIGTVEIRPAKNVSEMTTSTNSSESASTVLIEGEEGTAIERHRSDVQGLIGRRRERYVQQGGIPDAGVLTLLADAELDLFGRIPTEENIGISNAGLTPFRDFKVADWVWVRYAADEAPVERRVRQLAINVSENREISLGVTLNSILYENDIALQRKIEAYAGSGGNYGSVPNSGVDNSIPQKPNTVSVTSGAYVMSNGTIATAMVVNWVASSVNVDGTAMTDVAGHIVQWKYVADTAWSAEFPTTSTTFGYSPLTPGAQINVRVATVDQSGHRSEWTDASVHTLAIDVTPPPKPAAPTGFSRLGVIQVNWSGLTATGGTQPADFSYAEVHGSTNGSFVPTLGSATAVGRIDRGSSIVLSDLTYNSTWYYRIIAVDTSGNASTPSDASAGVVVKALVDTDVIGAVLDGAHLMDDTVKMTKLAIGDFQNLISDGLLQFPYADNWTGSSASIITSTTEPNKLRITANTTVTNLAQTQVVPGDVLRITAEIFGLSTNTVGSLLLNAHFIGENGTLLSTVNATTSTYGSVSNVWTAVGGSVTVPAGARLVEFSIQETGGPAQFDVRRVWMRRMTKGELIVDGTITATQIAALTISAGQLAANAVTATKIAASAVTADKIHVSFQGTAVNDNHNFEEEAVNASGVGLGVPTNWGTSPYGGGGTLTLETAAPLSGTKSARNTLAANTEGWVSMTGPKSTIQVSPTEKWFVSVRVKPVGGTGTGNSYLTLHTSASSANPIEGTWHDVHVLTPIANGSEVTLSGYMTVPAGHTRLTATLRLGARNAACYYVVDDFVVHPATDNSMITDLSPGKVITGLIQANVKIVAGAQIDAGARAQMTAAGFEAYDSGGTKTFTVQGSDGQTLIGNPANIHLAMSAYGNIWNSNISQAMLKFKYPGSGWSDGQLFSQYESDWAALRLQSPHVGDIFANTAILDLRGRNDGYTYAYLRAQEIQFTANTYLMGGTLTPANTVDFRLWGNSTGFTFTDFSGLSRLNMYADSGQFRLRSANSSGGVQKLVVNSSEIEFLINGESVYFNTNGTIGMRHFGQNVGFGYQRGRVIIATFAHDLHAGIEASSFQVNSDPRLKEDATEVTGALGVIRGLPVFDYKMKGILPRKSYKKDSNNFKEGDEIPANAARGVMADTLRKLQPDAVHEDENGLLSISVYDLLSTTIAALQESDARTDVLEQKVTTLMKGMK